MEVGEREAGMYDQYSYHGECGCCFHRAPLPVVALLRGAPHEATARSVRVLTHGGHHGIWCPTRALHEHVRWDHHAPHRRAPEHVGVYPAPITMPTSGSFSFTASSSAVRARFGNLVPGRRLSRRRSPRLDREHVQLGFLLAVRTGDRLQDRLRHPPVELEELV